MRKGGNGADDRLGYSPDGNRFLFTGREWLNDLKLYDYRARLYQPELGRFLQPDPKHFAAGDYNLYRYCHNDPVNKNDPTGLYERDVHYDLTRRLGAAAGLSDTQAAVIAKANQGVDEKPRTQPFASRQARRDYHFTTPERRNALRENAYRQKSAKAFWKFLHALQDSYSHQRGQTERDGAPFGTILGHLPAGHWPDKTHIRPGLAARMAEDTYRELRAFSKHINGQDSPDRWNEIRGEIGAYLSQQR